MCPIHLLVEKVYSLGFGQEESTSSLKNKSQAYLKMELGEALPKLTESTKPHREDTGSQRFCAMCWRQCGEEIIPKNQDTHFNFFLNILKN